MINKQRRVSLFIKSQYPDLYGYTHPWDIPGNEMCGSRNPLNQNKKKGEYPNFVVPFTSFEDIDSDTRYYPCSEELMKSDLREKARERKQQDILSRCMVYSDAVKRMVRCMKKCSECPFKDDPEHIGKENINFSNGFYRTGGMVYLDHLSNDEDENMEQADGLFASIAEEQFHDMEERLEREIILEELKVLVEKRCELDKKIYELFNLTNAEISRLTNTPRKTVSDHRKRMIDDFKKYFSK